ncbi:PucR family transcriptional regulator [Pseudalkalibacillus caeni]|uniref:PucR family transcriptional regulator n=1 Tax=Exobacillus caeni TaxID=2574798 RepID=A0A5R9F793_9BACL|nr:PucR family transcriptional regulator [Pseudalkalibacillus caeni]TLS38399.1 hypothetical protein FCL54_04450 [Pseudalkalibacillus caeni]
MAITIKEMLSLPTFNKAKLVAGDKGQSRSIRWVTIFEVLEDLDQLESGELLMTTAFDLVSNEFLKDTLIPNLVRQGLSGIVIQTGYYLEEIPEALIQYGNDYNFPVIEISKEVTFSEITKVIHKYIMNKQFEKIHFSERLYKQLTDIALKGQGIQLITSTISELIGQQLKVYDHNTNELFTSAQGPFSIDSEIIFNLIYSFKEEFDRGISTYKSIKLDEGYLFIAPIRSKQQVYGYFVALKSQPFNEFEEIAIQHASTICALEFIKISSLKEKEDKLQADFVEQLLTGDEKDALEIYSKGEALGYKIGTYETCVSIVSINDYIDVKKKEPETDVKVLQLMLKRLKENGLNVLFKLFSDKYVLLISNPHPHRVSLAKVFKAISQAAKSNYQVTLSTAIGNYYKEFIDYKRSYREAQETLSIIDSVWKKEKCLHYNDLGLYKLLLPLLDQSPEILCDFYKRTLGELLKHPDLLETLIVYMKKMKSNDAADALFIHRHTLKYRINKIESMINRDLLDFNDRLEVELALLIHHMFEEQSNASLPLPK